MFFLHWELQKPQLFFVFGSVFCCLVFEREGYDLTELDCNISIDLQKTSVILILDFKTSTVFSITWNKERLELAHMKAIF